MDSKQKYHCLMNEDDIKKATRQVYLPEPHRTVLDASMAALLNYKGEGFVKVTKQIDENGKSSLHITLTKT